MIKRKWMFLSIFILSMGLMGTAANAETKSLLEIEVKGEVTDAVTGEQLEGVEILLVELERTTETNSEGEFSFGALTPGFYTVSITVDGYEEFSETIEVAADETGGLFDPEQEEAQEEVREDAVELEIELQPLE